MAKNKNKGSDNGISVSSLFRDAGQRAKQNIEEQASVVLTDANGEVIPTSSLPYSPKIYNILEYIEQPWGLGMNLYPVQRFIVKLYYHIPLDDKNKTITITDMFSTKTLHHFTEVEYLRFLYDEGRCNIREQDHHRRQLVLALGRRSGKTAISGVFASYEVYRLLNLQNPQEYFGLPNGNKIQIISVATDKDQAGLLFNEVTSHMAKCDYFKPYIANNTQSHITLRTPYDIEKYGTGIHHKDGKFQTFNGKASLRVSFRSSIAKGLRGAGNYVVILDEVAHFQDKGQSSAGDIYKAVTPSTAAFSPKDPNNSQKPVGEVESRIILISSPLNRTGKFYELFHLALSKGPGSESLLAIQAPTWEVNPTIPASYYMQAFHEDPAVFMTEHGAQFSDRVRGWIEREVDLLACVVPDRKPAEVGVAKYPHQMGIDVGLVDDGTAVFITHVEDDRVILDYHEYWQAGVDWRESNPHLGNKFSTPYSKTLGNVERLDFDEISNWIYFLSKRFFISEGLFDRWNGIPLEQALIKKGLSQFRCEFFQRDLSSKIYQAAKMLMFDKKLELYDYPIPSGTKHSPFIQELLNLQAQQFSRNIVVVTKPDAPGNKDDMSDAFVRSVWLSIERMSNQKHVYGTHLGARSGGSSMRTAGHYQLMRARKHGMFTERMAPRSAMRRGR